MARAVSALGLACAVVGCTALFQPHARVRFSRIADMSAPLVLPAFKDEPFDIVLDDAHVGWTGSNVLLSDTREDGNTDVIIVSKHPVQRGSSWAAELEGEWCDPVHLSCQAVEGTCAVASGVGASSAYSVCTMRLHPPPPAAPIEPPYVCAAEGRGRPCDAPPVRLVKPGGGAQENDTVTYAGGRLTLIEVHARVGAERVRLLPVGVTETTTTNTSDSPGCGRVAFVLPQYDYVEPPPSGYARFIVAWEPYSHRSSPDALPATGQSICHLCFEVEGEESGAGATGVITKQFVVSGIQAKASERLPNTPVVTATAVNTSRITAAYEGLGGVAEVTVVLAAAATPQGEPFTVHVEKIGIPKGTAAGGRAWLSVGAPNLQTTLSQQSGDAFSFSTGTGSQDPLTLTVLVHAGTQPEDVQLAVGISTPRADPGSTATLHVFDIEVVPHPPPVISLSRVAASDSQNGRRRRAQTDLGIEVTIVLNVNDGTATIVDAPQTNANRSSSDAQTAELTSALLARLSSLERAINTQLRNDVGDAETVRWIAAFASLAAILMLVIHTHLKLRQGSLAAVSRKGTSPLTNGLSLA
jgi:hypothetical protein